MAATEKKIAVRSRYGDYTVYIKRGGINDAKKYFDLERRVLVVSDSGVPKKYRDAVLSAAKEGFLFEFPEGEESKTLVTFEKILKTLSENGFDRGDCIVAVGGGVVGDIAGFAASAYMRGIDYYNIPTTLLSQVDSSVGGKTGVNLGGIKNTVGAFYPPRAVITDPETLSTLPERIFSEGLIEAIKTGLVADEEIFSIFKNGEEKERLDEVIEKSIAAKVRIVEADENEGGLRKALNFGHTLGHAIEAESRGRLYHGECVALGMLPMCSPEIRTELLKIYSRLSVPTEAHYSREALYAALCRDKKKNGDKITVVTVSFAGKPEFSEMTAEEILKGMGNK